MNFDLLEPLGQGRVGTIYRGNDPESGQEVAVKRVGADGLAQLTRGFQAQSSLDHPHVLRAHRLHLEEEQGYMVIDLADGHPSAPVDATDVPAIAIALGSALHHIHSCGWIHRDVKPANLLLRDGRLVLADFGLALPTTAKGMVAPVGTPPYMAPECFAWSSTEAMDWFSLGVTLYELLAGRLPFDGESLQDELLAKQQGCFDLSAIPQPLHALFLGLLNPNAHERWTFEEVAAFCVGARKAA